MVVIAQAVKTVATRRPMEETRKSWLNLLNFMRFLRCGLVSCEPQENWLGCPVCIVKARYGVLLECPAEGLCPGSLLRAAVRNRGHGRRLGVGRVRRELRVDECARGGAQLKVGDVVAEKISGEKEVVGRWVDAHGHRLNSCGVRADAGESAATDRIRAHRAVQTVCHVSILAGWSEI